MVSEMAKEDIENLIAEGLHPSVEEIVRLNALGLKVEYAENGGDWFAMPRVSYLGDVQFREPTLGHGMWLEQMLKVCDKKDFQTVLIVTAFAISRRVEDLPDCHDVKSCRRRIESFVKQRLSGHTMRQIQCAVDYAMCGSDQTSNEYADGNDGEADPAESVYVGYLLHTISLGLGMTVSDMKGMTLSQLKSLQELAYKKSGVNFSKIQKGNATGDYFNTLNHMKNRLSEKVKNG